MRARAFTWADYPEICQWWLSHKWPVIPSDHLSSIGIVVEENEKLVSACWVYVTNSAFGLLEFVVTNPKVSLRMRAKGIELMLDAAVKVAQEHHVKTLFSSLKSHGLIRAFEKSGFLNADTDMTNLIRKI